jgi:NADPH-dependent curcumin reductase
VFHERIIPLCAVTSNRQWLVERSVRPGEVVGREHFRWIQSSIPRPAAGQVLVRTILLGTSPAQRGYISTTASMHEKIALGSVMRGRGIGIVAESQHPDYAVGDVVAASTGWQDYAVLTPPPDLTPRPGTILSVVRVRNPTRPLSHHLGMFGNAGATAYFGLLDVGLLVSGDTLVVSAAAGGVGCMVVQIGKALGCRVIGVAGGPGKCAWLRDVLRVDAAIDYRNDDLDQRLAELCPQGVNVFFDNVGGAQLDTVLRHLALGARVVICGWISTDYASNSSPGPANYKNLLRKRARMQGFYTFDYLHRYSEAEEAMRRWHARGLIQPCEDIDDGLECMPDTLGSLFAGRNRGIKLCRVASDAEAFA